MTLPRRLQLVKLLRAHGLRDVERMREADMREALKRLRVVVPEPPATPSSSSLVSRPAEPPPAPPVEDTDDPWALPRFREPKLSLPSAERTFLRAISVKPRLLFCTWDVAAADRALLTGVVELQVFWREFLGDAPDASSLLRQSPSLRAEVTLSSEGWYLTVPGERLALMVALVEVSTGRHLARSNLALTPPARPAPPGPYWVAKLPPHLSRRRLAERSLLKGQLDDVEFHRVGETDARFLDELEDEEHQLPSSAAALRPPRGEGIPSSSVLPLSRGAGPSGGRP